MNKVLLFVLLFSGISIYAQERENQSLNIIAIGAHPDDVDSRFGGTAAL